MPTERATPLVAVRRHLLISVLAVLVATGIGVGIGLSRAPTFTAETRLAVGGNSLSAQAVPGYALAAQELAADYARYVNNAQQQTALDRQLGARPGGITKVTASPIPESNVVRIEVEGHDEATTVSGAARVATTLMQQVNNPAAVNTKADDLLKQYTDISNKVAAAQQASDAAQNAVDTVTGQSVPHPERASQLPKLRQAAAEAAAQLAILQVQQQALGDKYRSIISDNSGISTQLAVVENAVSTGSNRTTRAEQWGLGGLAAGCVLALVLATVLERRPGSVRERPHPVPGTVTDPHDSGSPTVARGPLSRSLTGPGDRTD